jgi:hypothetical protein
MQLDGWHFTQGIIASIGCGVLQNKTHIQHKTFFHISNIFFSFFS